MKSVGKQKIIILASRILLSIACLLWLGFILSNSLRTGEQSSAQSKTVVETIQQVAKVIAPASKIANATGDTYDKLHAVVRAFAHFTEFAILGALLGWCYFAYTVKWKLFFLPCLGAVLTAVVDEWLQSFVTGRGWEIVDLLLDGLGGFAGLLLAALSVVIGLWIYEKRARKTADKYTMYENI